MADVALQTPEQGQSTTEQQVQPDVNQQLANSLWSNNFTPVQQTPPTAPQNEPPASEAHTPPANEDYETVSLEDYFQREFGVDPTSAKVEWENLRKLKDAPPQQAAPFEPQFANDESKKLFEALKSGKTDEIYSYLHQQQQLTEAANLNAAEAIKLHIKLTNPHFKPEDVADVFEEKYTFPPKPAQEIDEADDMFQARMDQYQHACDKIHRRIERDAFTAKEGLSQLKSQLVFPDIPTSQTSQLPDQKELEAAHEAARQDFLQNLGSAYQNFKGFNVTAKDGEVQLPISYTISPEELDASKQMLENFNVNEFLDNRWVVNGKPNILQMQEDLYLLMNRDRVFQKIANEAAAQRFLHQQKVQNNIKLNGVNSDIVPPQLNQKSESEVLAENIWKF